jgi:quaternary ammonium compound-resistance protein SugE
VKVSSSFHFGEPGRDAPYPVRKDDATEVPMSWLYLLLAGLLEIVWAIGLKYTQGFSRPVPSALTGVAVVASLWLLSVAVRGIPIGTAYAIWTGIGVAGAAVLGIVLFDEPLTLARIACLVLLVGALVGLKLTAAG